MEPILAAVIAAFLSSYLTTIFAARRYRAERFWDRKAAAYGEVVSAIRKSIRYAANYRDMYDGRDNSGTDGVLEALLKEANLAKDNVEKTYDDQYLFLSSEARNKVEKYLYDESHFHPDLSGDEMADVDLQKHNSLLKELFAISKNELF